MRPLAVMLFLPLGFSLMGQSYLPLLDDLGAWQDENATASPGPNTASFECLRYYLDGDSVVDNVTYQILRQTGRRRYSDLIDSSHDHTYWYDGHFAALLREDTSNRRVYIRPPDWWMDLLFYDFSAGVGPYPSTYRFYQSPGREVVSVDTIWLTDGPHRRINFDEYRWIAEGIGSSEGLMESGIMGEIPYMGRQVCHTLNGIPNYIVSSLDCACGSNVSVPSHAIRDLHVSPSPSSNTSQLNGAVPHAPFRIRALDGRIVHAGVCSENGTATLDMSSLPAAIYLVEVIDTVGTRMVKIVKE